MYDFADYTKFRGSVITPKKEVKPELLEVFSKSLEEFLKGE